MQVRELDWFRGEEGALLARLLSDPGDAGAREAYAAWLASRGDPRGELLRLEAALSASEPPAEGPRLRARLEALEAEAPEPWWSWVRTHAPLRNCGAAAGREPFVRFRFECPRAWASLAPTEAPDVRACDGCGERVYLCRTADEAAERARAGHCIAVDAALAGRVRGEVCGSVTGRPDFARMWAARIFGGDPGDG